MMTLDDSSRTDCHANHGTERPRYWLVATGLVAHDLRSHPENGEGSGEGGGREEDRENRRRFSAGATSDASVAGNYTGLS